ncbi:uncharacterized protein AAG666_002563 isoform 1-T1 [Megaptera novaeangliae]
MATKHSRPVSRAQNASCFSPSWIPLGNSCTFGDPTASNTWCLPEGQVTFFVRTGAPEGQTEFLLGGGEFEPSEYFLPGGPEAFKDRVAVTASLSFPRVTCVHPAPPHWPLGRAACAPVGAGHPEEPCGRTRLLRGPQAAGWLDAEPEVG